MNQIKFSQVRIAMTIVLLPTIVMLVIGSSTNAFAQNEEPIKAHIHIIEIKDMGEKLSITNTSATYDGKEEVINAIKNLPESKNTDTSVINNELQNTSATEVVSSLNYKSKLIGDINASDDKLLHIDHILLEHEEDTHQFAVVHGE